MVLFVYLLPCIWLAYLLALGTELLLAVMLNWLPIGLVELLSEQALFIAILGGVFVLAGNAILLWEMSENKHFDRNFDFILTVLGAALLMLAFLLTPDWVQMQTGLVALILAPTAVFYMVRYLVKYTRTALESVVVFLLLLAVNMLGSWALL